MTKFESSVKQIPYPVEDVYRNISDLSNLERVRDRIPEDKLNSFSFDQDSVSVNVAPVGDLKLRIIEREENKCVKFEGVQTPLPFNLWIQVLPVSETESKLKVTVQADIPSMHNSAWPVSSPSTTCRTCVSGDRLHPVTPSAR